MIKTIIKHTLIETTRSRIYISSIALLFIFAFVSWMGSDFNQNYGEAHLAVFSFGCLMTEWLMMAIALFYPISHLASEYERGSAFVIWSKIPSRFGYFFGKYLAFLLLMAFLIFLSVLSLGLVSYLIGIDLTVIGRLRYFILGSILQIICIQSMVFFFFALLNSAILSSLLSFLVLIFTVFLTSAKEIASVATGTFVKYFYNFIYLTLPQLSYFDYERVIIYGDPLPLSLLWVSVIYGLTWGLVVWLLAGIIYSRQDL